MKAIRIIFYNIKISMLNELAHKVNFLMRFLSDSIFFFVYFIFYTVIYTYVDNINGWGKYDMLFLMGTFHCVLSLFLGFYVPNIARIPELVKSGGLDGYLVKPIDSQFLLSIRVIDIGSLINVFLGISITVTSARELNLKFDTIIVILYIYFVLIGAFIMYNLLFILICSIFWLNDSSWSISFFMTFNSFADKPISIYKGAIYRFLVYLFPVGLVANIPAHIVLNNSKYNLRIWFVMSAILFFFLSRLIWLKGIKLYEGASI